MRPNTISPPIRQVVAAVVGNALEWYDFIVFGFMTGIISSVFFPVQNAYSSLLLTTATFGVGFAMRPIGGILIGIYADRCGRKAALQCIIGLMTVATALLAFSPTYASIGMISSLLIVIARMLQGLATGGEFATSTALLIEIAPPSKRGLYGSWQMTGQGLSLLGGAAIGALITHNLSHQQLYGWGWRIPFIIGLAIAPVGFWIRRHLNEPMQAPVDPNELGVNPSMTRALGHQTKPLMASALLTASATIAFYILVIYMPTFANRSLGIALDSAFIVQCSAIAVMTVITPLSGALSDKIGRKPLLQGSLALYFILLLPLFKWLIATPTVAHLAVTQISLCAVLGVLLGPYATAIAEQFTSRVRSTGMAISYNHSVMIFGGFAQFIVTWLLHISGSLLTPGVYLLFGAALGLVGSFLLSKRQHTEAGNRTREQSVENALTDIADSTASAPTIR